MRLAAVLDEAIGVAEAVKNIEIAHGHDELATQLIVHRGDRAVATIIFRKAVSQAELMRAITLAAFGFDADAMALITEAYASPTEINPLTGLPWRHGEVDDVAHLESEEWATPTLLVTAINRAGDICAATLPYRRQDGFRWMEQRLFQPEEADLAPELKTAMSMPPFGVVVPAGEDERNVRDNWTAEHLEDFAPCVVRLLDGVERERARTLPINRKAR